MRFTVLALLLFAQGLPAQSAETKQHIAHIEEGLLPPVKVTNRPPTRMTMRDDLTSHRISAVSVAIIRNGRIEWAKAYGIAADNAPATTDTLFQAASISKSIATMGALHLVEEHKLSLDAPVDTELKSWKLSAGKSTPEEPVTLRRLLSHTAGTNVHGFFGYASDKPVPTLIQVLNGAKPANSPAVVVDQVPGQRFSYSGGGFEVLQQMMQDASGSESFPQLMKRTVLQPLGMRHSTYEQPLPTAMRRSVSLPVDEKGVPIAGGPHTYPEMAAAGLWTTPTDLATWMIAMQQSLAGHSNPVLSSEMSRTMLTPVKDNYGLGVEVSSVNNVLHFSHGGSNVGYRSRYFADSQGNGAVIMTSSDGGDVLIGDFLRAVAAEYGWNAFHQTDRTAADVAFDQQQPYVGKFQSKDGFRFDVTAEKGELTIHFSDGASGPFLPSDNHSFFTVLGTLQVVFNSPDHGEVFWSPSDKEEFSRIP